MALFVDREVAVESNSIQLEIAWHPRSPLLALGAYSEDKGGYVRVVEGSGSGGSGEVVSSSDPVVIPPHPTAQVRVGGETLEGLEDFEKC